MARNDTWRDELEILTSDLAAASIINHRGEMWRSNEAILDYFSRAIAESDKNLTALKKAREALKFYADLGEQLQTSYGHDAAKRSMINDYGSVARAALSNFEGVDG